jgi:hypothetical protein
MAACFVSVCERECVCLCSCFHLWRCLFRPLLLMAMLSLDVCCCCDRSTKGNPACTYVGVGPLYRPQTWFWCTTCRLTGSEGVCEPCARVCHAGHVLSEVRLTCFLACRCDPPHHRQRTTRHDTTRCPHRAPSTMY